MIWLLCLYPLRNSLWEHLGVLRGLGCHGLALLWRYRVACWSQQFGCSIFHWAFTVYLTCPWLTLSQERDTQDTNETKIDTCCWDGLLFKMFPLKSMASGEGGRFLEHLEHSKKCCNPTPNNPLKHFIIQMVHGVLQIGTFYLIKLECDCFIYGSSDEISMTVFSNPSLMVGSCLISRPKHQESLFNVCF